jgi:MFS family permease
MRTRQVSTPWLRWVEPWYLAYTLLGATVGGLVPIVLPLTVHRTGGTGYTGLVMAAFSLGGLTAPLWGSLADHYRLHRWLFTCGLLTTALGLAVFHATTALAAWVGLALLQGIGTSCTATMAHLLVIEVHPQSEWDERIGWLQTFYGVGQVGGLALAGVLTRGAHLHVGLLAAASLAGLAVLPAWLCTPTPPGFLSPRPVLPHHSRHSEWPHESLQRLLHHLSWKALYRGGQHLRVPFALFLLSWLVAFIGSSAFFSLYPVLMQHLYGVSPGLAAAGSAIAYSLGLALYSPAGACSERQGPSRVLRLAFSVRLLAFCGLFGLGLTRLEGRGWLALLSFLCIVLSWPLLSVSGTALTARLAQKNEGEGIGLFHATSALAGVVGAALGGWVAAHAGYHAAVGLAVVGVALGLTLSSALCPVLPSTSVRGRTDSVRRAW